MQTRKGRVRALVLIPAAILAFGALLGLVLPRLHFCPRCFSTDTAPIMYGLPMFTDELEQALANHELVLGGCLVTLFQPTHYCFNCEWSFGFYTLLGWFSVAAMIALLALAIVAGRARRKAKLVDTNPQL